MTSSSIIILGFLILVSGTCINIVGMFMDPSNSIVPPPSKFQKAHYWGLRDSNTDLNDTDLKYNLTLDKGNECGDNNASMLLYNVTNVLQNENVTSFPFETSSVLPIFDNRSLITNNTFNFLSTSH